MRSFITGIIACLLISTPLTAEITSSIDGSRRLTVNTTAGEDCIVSVDNGFVKINGSDPDTGPLPVADMFTFDFFGDEMANRVDVSAITVANFPSFGRLDIDVRGGDDIVVGSEYGDNFRLGDGIDTIESFGGGSDVIYWSRFDGSEVLDNTGGTGTVRLLYGGSTGSDDLIVDAVGNTLTVTDDLTSEMISVINPTVLALQMNNGEDTVLVNDLSSLTTFDSVFCNKSSGFFTFDAAMSNVKTTVNSNFSDFGTDVSVTPFTESGFLEINQFAQDPLKFDVSKQGQSVIVEIENPAATHRLTGLSTIFLGGSAFEDTYNIEDIGSDSLRLLTISPGDSGDTINTVFLTNTEIDISERSSQTGTDTLTIDAEGKPAGIENSTAQTIAGFGDIEFENMESVNLINEIPFPDTLWVFE